jgi:hypothetical protein
MSGTIRPIFGKLILRENRNTCQYNSFLDSNTLRCLNSTHHLMSLSFWLLLLLSPPSLHSLQHCVLWIRLCHVLPGHHGSSTDLLPPPPHGCHTRISIMSPYPYPACPVARNLKFFCYRFYHIFLRSVSPQTMCIVMVIAFFISFLLLVSSFAASLCMTSRRMSS